MFFLLFVFVYTATYAQTCVQIESLNKNDLKYDVSKYMEIIKISTVQSQRNA